MTPGRWVTRTLLCPHGIHPSASPPMSHGIDVPPVPAVRVSMDAIADSTRVAPGGPGLPPRWTRGAKEAVGTAYSTASHVWYTVAAGILTEVFYTTIDTPQIRDLQFLITDGQPFFHDERRSTVSTIDCIDDASLGFNIVNVAEKPRYALRK